GLIGPGLVGSELLEQIRRRAANLHDEQQLDLRVRGIARSSRMILGERRIDLEGWRDGLAASEMACNLDRFVEHVDADHMPHSVIIDCTSDSGVAARYAEWLERGIHVITPNKKAFSGDQAYCENLRSAAERGSAHYLYETTVGAALPIVSTLRGLVDTGDRIRSIRGILSGTLAYLFNVYDGTQPFSSIVRQAKESGYTEPDPRDDLSGTDVARKLIILAREMGQSLELGDFPVQNLVPESLRDVSTEQFLDELANYDDEIATLYREAVAENKVLRYVASLTSSGEAAVGLQKVSTDSALAHIRLTDNIVQFVTDRYDDNPLCVQGPGAGPAVTASGVFGDLLRLSAYLQGAG
ncbi:MAG: bifunctional aspartate kinase/homoserine dehydrogenase I, partial [Woeseia sp.]|nr:bifunctional aspartate kinase/homoserine dehydrogenase I [Woeseia sp.]